MKYLIFAFSVLFIYFLRKLFKHFMICFKGETRDDQRWRRRLKFSFIFLDYNVYNINIITLLHKLFKILKLN